MNIQANIDEYLRDLRPKARYASFDYCFNYFQTFADEGRTVELADEANLQQSCLQLGFYLASWGMFRGSTALLDSSLAALKPVVAAIADAEPELWSLDVDRYSDESIESIICVGEDIRAALTQEAQTRVRVPTDTLVTKVMLGTFGCVPAFDTNFKWGSRWWNFDRPRLGLIKQFYALNAAVIDKNLVETIAFGSGSSTGRKYTRAKLIDMIFFIEGDRVRDGRRRAP